MKGEIKMSKQIFRYCDICNPGKNHVRSDWENKLQFLSGYCVLDGDNNRWIENKDKTADICPECQITHTIEEAEKIMKSYKKDRG